MGSVPEKNSAHRFHEEYIYVTQVGGPTLIMKRGKRVNILGDLVEKKKIHKINFMLEQK